MRKYNHIKHAGNVSDVIKHVFLVCCLESIKKSKNLKDEFFYVDMHGGNPSHQLLEHGEWVDGIGKLKPYKKDEPTWISMYRSLNDVYSEDGVRLYLGSSALVQAYCKMNQINYRFQIYGIDSQTYEELIEYFYDYSDCVSIKKENSYKAIGKIEIKPDLVLIDPPDILGHIDELMETMDNLQMCKIPFLCWTPIKNVYDDRDGNNKKIRLSMQFMKYVKSKNILFVDFVWNNKPKKITGCRICVHGLFSMTEMVSIRESIWQSFYKL